MDLYFDKKEMKKFKKLGLTQRQIEEHRLDIIRDHLLEENCRRLSLELGKEIVFSKAGDNVKLFLKTKSGRFCELSTSYKDVICDYTKAYSEINHEITTRLYYVQ